jgi:poly(3-hydroxybutyrate) depolymerase
MKTGPIAFVFLLIALVIPVSGQKVRKETFEFEGKKRSYYLFVPETANPEHPAPMILLLHGSGHNGSSLTDKWKALAISEGIVLVAPDSLNSETWNIPLDGPDFLHELISQLKSTHPIDSRRMYLFGHSGGAIMALHLALIESEYFAAVAVHAGMLQKGDGPIVEQATRKTPIYIVVGTNDPLFPLEGVHATHDYLTKRGFEVQLVEMKGHDHWYYDLAPKINAEAWLFLKMQKLAAEPRYTQYTFKK